MLRSWDVESTELLPMPEGAERSSSVVAMSPDGEHLAHIASSEIRIVSIASNKVTQTIALPKELRGVGQLIYSDFGDLLALGYSTSDEVHVKIWQVQSGNELHQFTWNKGPDPHADVEALNFSANGKRIAAGVFRQNKAYTFDLTTDELVSEVKHNNVYGLDLNKDGTRLYTTGWDKAVRIWDCDTGEPLADQLIQGANAQVELGRRVDTRAYGLCLSPDEKTIAVCTMNRSIHLFDLELNEFAALRRLVYLRLL